jgi:hypothetical protein
MELFANIQNCFINNCNIKNIFCYTLSLAIVASVKTLKILTKKLVVLKGLNPDVSPYELMVNDMIYCLNHVVDSKQEYRENETYDFNWAKMKFEEVRKRKDISERDFKKYTNITYFDSPYIDKVPSEDLTHSKNFYNPPKELAETNCYTSTFGLIVEEDKECAEVSDIVYSSNKTKIVSKFSVGDNVRIIDGPFTGFYGTIKKIKPDSRQLVVKASVLGKETTILVGFIQAELLGEEKIPDTKNSHQLLWK